MLGSKTITLTSQPYYDQYNKCYKNIITVNDEPQGPLRELVRKIQSVANSKPKTKETNKRCSSGSKL